MRRSNTDPVADVAVFNLMTDEFGYADAANGRAEGTQRLFCELTLKGGKVARDWNVRTAQDYRKLGDRYSMRQVDHNVLPKE